MHAMHPHYCDVETGQQRYEKNKQGIIDKTQDICYPWCHGALYKAL